MNPEFWKDRKVFLTGHTGFKGSWMSLWLESLGASVTGYALAPATTPSLFKEANIKENMNSIIADIRDLEKLSSAIAKAKPEIIFHMAAQPLVRYSYQNPIETYSTNVMGTANLLEAVRHTPDVKAVVNITTDKCYQNKEWVWSYRENEPMGGYDPYSSSKACSELITSAYRSSYFGKSDTTPQPTAIATARAGNVIGPGDWSPDRLLPDILAGLEKNKEIVIRSPSAIRPWQHVLEPLYGYLKLAEQLHKNGSDFAESWNFGPSDTDIKTVGWIVDKMINLWGENASWKVDASPQPHEASFLSLDISKARHKLKWNPTLSIDQSLDMIIDWVKRRQNGENARELTMQQILNFQNKIQQPK